MDSDIEEKRQNAIEQVQDWNQLWMYNDKEVHILIFQIHCLIFNFFASQ